MRGGRGAREGGRDRETKYHEMEECKQALTN